MFRPAWVAAVAALLSSFASPLAHAAITDQAIFVAKSGSDANAGTQALPKLTIAAGITAAVAGTIPNVVVSKGVYVEVVNLPNGVSLFGGYDATAGWTRSPANTTTIQAPGKVLLIQNYASIGQVEGFTIQATSLVAPGASSIGIILNNAGGIRISRNVVVAAAGINGTAGNNGPAITPSTAASGGIGAAACSGTGCGVGGTGGSSSCANPGGKGGNGGFNSANGQLGSVGSGGAPGGPAGVAAPCSSPSGPGGSGVSGAAGASGSPGTGGTGGTPSPAGWVSTAGTNGVAGANAKGGGGGGGGGGGSTMVFPSCVGETGGGGGGGGAGGCGGNLGQGGGGGGGSIAILSLSSAAAQILENDIQTGAGGNGGKGGNGSQAQQGGAGANPGALFDNAGAGGQGGNGGNGGGGGGGGGGAGGPSVGVYATGGVGLASNTITVGLSGTGGLGGSNGAPLVGVASSGGGGSGFPAVGASVATPPTLTVAKAGTGTGTVASDVGWIDCGATCSELYGAGVVVSLAATVSAGSTFTGWSGDCTGTGACSVTMSAARNVTATFALADPPRLSNISTRMQVLTGNDVMIGGFVIGGVATKRVAIVATGPSLTQYGIANALANPTLSLVRSSDQAVLATSDDWQTAANSAQLTAAGFAPSNTLEAALLVDLAPGAYTAIVEGASAGTGVAVIGVYEVNTPDAPLINISTRGRVLTGNDVMIGGFIVTGSGPQTVAIVATGPSLAQYGIASPLANPSISLVRSSDQAVLATNDDWQSDANASLLQSAGFAPTNPLESGLYTTLPPGAYTVIVQGVNNGTGVAVIGVYKVN